METILAPAISQSLIKEITNQDCCPKQIYFAFVEGKELIEPSENMLLGRYFESELLGACRGGEKQPAKTLKSGEKSKPFSDCDLLIEFAKDVFDKIGLEVNPENAQQYLIEDFLSGNIDLIANDIQGGEKDALYDLKWTATKLDDRWNGWGDPDNKSDAHLQAVHYVYLFQKKYGYFPKFYFLIFGKDFWVKVIQFKISKDTISEHTARIQTVSEVLKEMAANDFKGNGNFNKCQTCPFNRECEDKTTIPEIETYYI